MLIVHSSLVIDDPEEYLADKGYAMPFATDDEDDTVLNIVGGTGAYPQTVVLNRYGEVVYNKIGSVTPELLSALYDEADGVGSDVDRAPGPVGPVGFAGLSGGSGKEKVPFKN